MIYPRSRIRSLQLGMQYSRHPQQEAVVWGGLLRRMKGPVWGPVGSRIHSLCNQGVTCPECLVHVDLVASVLYTYMAHLCANLYP